jgi:hypothetical protein
MDHERLARAIAADISPEVAAYTEKLISGEPPAGDDSNRAIGIAEATAIASVLLSAVQLAIQVWHKQRDRTLVLEVLLEQAPDHPRLDPERRLTIIGQIADRLMSENGGSSQLLAAPSQKSKQEWLEEWLGTGTRGFTPTVLMPFADMDYYAVYRQISWTRPSSSHIGLPDAITVPRGFVTDLASVPSIFWSVLPPQGRYGHAAILHDWLYWDQYTSREIADRIFDVAMDELGVAPVARKAMWASVRVFGGKPWTDNATRRKAGQSRLLRRFPDSSAVRWIDWSKQPEVFV